MGIDFSGAAQSGKTAWCAEIRLETGPKGLPRLVSLRSLGDLAGGDDRDCVNRYLVDRILMQSKTFWGCDFPFGLPIELRLGRWREQLRQLQEFEGDAKAYGHYLVARTEELCEQKHVRRLTDRETQTPFDCYHYRIIYQTFHGMRDVLNPVASKKQVAILPFQSKKLFENQASSYVVEACPSSTLKRWGLPHRLYKQSGGKPPDETHRQNRRTILKRLTQSVEISAHRRRLIMNDPGGDALDAVIAGIGSWQGFNESDHVKVSQHARYPREGRVYC